MTPKQSQFVHEYLIDLNATQAAIRSGYSSRTAQQIGEENLKKPVIARAIEIAMAARAHRTNVTADRVVLEMARIAFFDLRDVLRPDGTVKLLHELDAETAAALVAYEVAEATDEHGGERRVLKKLKTGDKLAALQMLGRHLGLFNDKLQVEQENPLSLLIKEIQGSALKPVRMIDGRVVEE